MPLRQAHQAALGKFGQRIAWLGSAKPGDGPPSPGDEHLLALFDSLEVLAEPIMQLPHTNLSTVAM